MKWYNIGLCSLSLAVVGQSPQKLGLALSSSYVGGLVYVKEIQESAFYEGFSLDHTLRYQYDFKSVFVGVEGVYTKKILQYDTESALKWNKESTFILDKAQNKIINHALDLQWIAGYKFPLGHKAFWYPSVGFQIHHAFDPDFKYPFGGLVGLGVRADVHNTTVFSELRLYHDFSVTHEEDGLALSLGVLFGLKRTYIKQIEQF